MNSLPIPDIPLSEQRAIAATLGALDGKIELNRKMNSTLDSMARALFRDWFVDFGPTRAKMAGTAPYLSDDLWSLFPDRLDDEGKPEGWEIRSLGDFADLKGGKQLEKEHISSTGPIPVFGGAGVMGFTANHNAEGFFARLASRSRRALPPMWGCQASGSEAEPVITILIRPPASSSECQSGRRATI